MTPRRKITIILASFFVLAAALIGLAVVLYQNNSETTPSTEPDQAAYSDPYSGETLLNPEGKVPEGATTDAGEVVVLGLSKVIDYGLSVNQSDQVKEQLLIYADTTKLSGQDIREVSFASDSFKQTIDKSSGERTLKATIRVNRSTNQTIHMIYVGTNDMLVRIYAGNKMIFQTPYDE